MLIPDLLNILFDQSNYKTVIMLSLLHKRKTTYACKYSLLSRYNKLNKNKSVIDEYPKAIIHFVHNCFSALFCLKMFCLKITSFEVSTDGKIMVFDFGIAYVFKLWWSANSSHLSVVVTLINLLRTHRVRRAHALLKMFNARSFAEHKKLIFELNETLFNQSSK